MKEKERQRSKLDEISKAQSGFDEDDKVYKNIGNMWDEMLQGDKENNWYKKSVVYWDE